MELNMLKSLFRMCDLLYVIGFVVIVAGVFGDHNLILIGVSITIIAVFLSIFKVVWSRVAHENII